MTFSTKEEADEISHDLVKTKGQISQFVRELSRTFPEAGLPLEVEQGSNWHTLLAAIHSFNSSKCAETANSLVKALASFEALNGMMYAW